LRSISGCSGEMGLLLRYCWMLQIVGGNQKTVQDISWDLEKKRERESRKAKEKQEVFDMIDEVTREEK